MTAQNIKKWYVSIGLLNLVLSLILFFILDEENLEERGAMLIVPNIGYHLLYAFIGFFPRGIIKRIVDENRIVRISIGMNRLFAYTLIVLGILMFTGILIHLVSKSDPRAMLAFSPLGMTLGGFSLLNFLIRLKPN